jgi:hypothetical protein
MGSYTDANIKAFQKNTSIEPASAEYAAILNRMAQEAFALIRVIERELSGIRDGDGLWHGSDPVARTMDRLVEAWESVNWEQYTSSDYPCVQSGRMGPAVGGMNAPSYTNAKPRCDE